MCHSFLVCKTDYKILLESNWKLQANKKISHLIDPGEWHNLTPTLVLGVFQAYKSCSWTVNVLIPQAHPNLTNIIGAIGRGWNDMRLYATKLRKHVR